MDFWSPVLLFLWQIGKPFSYLKGDEVKAFVLNGKDISKFLINTLEPIDEILSLTKALMLWYKIEKFLKIGHVINNEVQSFPSKIDKFEANIKFFYWCRFSSFMTKVHVGDQETYSLHELRFCIPTMTRKLR